MLITGIKSRPVYDQLHPMAGGTHHIIAGQGSGGRAMLRLLDDMSGMNLKTTLLYSRESFSGQDFLSQLQAQFQAQFQEQFQEQFHAQLQAHLQTQPQAQPQARQVNELRVHASNQELIADLQSLLGAAFMGTRLYLSGSESFIGRAMQIASLFDLNRDEVLREHSGTLVRRVWCVHCDTFTENVTQRIFKCPGCKLDLVVRDHYSRRLAAFQAVKADGEVPGELPAAEELDT
ncbi:dimethylamine monooxygenase subunit DmmA family protein [Lacisediminimonas profundi]|uniref:dimethylamine monooxygenase subunit DmmA family protein n=1 Tax=Lacisediminimonas profundi TaxID=2603856 RepID=UPI00124AF3F5|nr:dimethylamine monooxygenase subunit DmmA family protein [Lacisediminimonas profundi]